jgi:molybdate transport system substrate-binding protein
VISPRRIIAFAIASLLACGSASAQALTVAAASDLQAALPAIVSQFEKDTGQSVRVAFGSSGNLFTQIRNGAPFDVFLSADIDYPRQLEASGHAERGSLYQYATGRIVLWTRKDSGVDVRRGLAVLTDAHVHRIAIANPRFAPYGRAAVAALRHDEVYEKIEDKLVLGDNIAQTTQFAQSGSADAGIIGLSAALTETLRRAGAYFEIPDAWYPPIEQAAVVLAASRQKALAHQFVEFLKSPASRSVLQSDGFAVPRASR